MKPTTFHDGDPDEAQSTKGPEDHYRELLQEYIPIYTSRLVRHTTIPYDVRDQVTSPEQIVDVLKKYFYDKDREEFLVILLDTVMWD